MQKYKSLIIKILVSILLFGFLFSKIDVNSVVQNFSLIDFTYVPVIILLLVLNYVLSSVRWKALLIFDNTDDVSVSYLTTLYFVGSFFNNFMPTSIGGDVYKFVKLGKKIGSIAHGFSATFMERFTGVIILFLITLLSFPLVLSDFVDLPVVGSVLGGSKVKSVLLSIFIFILFILGLRIGLWVLEKASERFPKLKKIYSSVSEYENRQDIIKTALLTSVLVQLMSIFTQYFIFSALGVRIPIFYTFTVFPVIALISFLPISLNSIGVQDALYVNLFGVVGISPEISLSASILYHLFRLGVSLIGGLLYALGKDS
ncbi:flippase-like domain-containing protein [Patescibacteria group bacterium]|nr:flippase-like domain-containing protein [Patescibacteria group bacterium]